MSDAEWERVMDPLRDTPLWPQIRQAAVTIIVKENERRAIEDGVPGAIYGISSSDVNHTVFDVARRLDPAKPDYDRLVLRRLVAEMNQP